MQDCSFCSDKNLSEHGIIYEDSKCRVVVDKYPISRGHLLVIPKKHYQDMLDTPKDVIDDTYEVAKKAAQIVKERLDPDGGINVVTNIGKIAGQFIMHFHIHVIPRYKYAHNPMDTFKFDHEHLITNELRDELVKLLKFDSRF